MLAPGKANGMMLSVIRPKMTLMYTTVMMNMSLTDISLTRPVACRV
jgi:hypothetical protein